MDRSGGSNSKLFWILAGGILIDILSSKRSDPLARGFAEEFLANAGLRKVWQDFERTGDLEAFAKALRSSGAFGRLLDKYAGLPGFKGLAQDLAGRIPLARFAAEGSALLGGSGILGRKGRTGRADKPGFASRSGETSHSAGEEFRYFSDPVLAGLGFYLNDPRVMALSFGLDAREAALLQKTLQELPEGASSWDACERAGLLPECIRMVQDCMKIQGCVKLTNPASPTTLPTTTPTTTPTTEPPTAPTTSPTTAPTTTDPCAAAVCPQDCGFCPNKCGPCPAPCNNNGTCDSNETCCGCRNDCCPCGDRVCSGGCGTPPETCANCPQDCCPPPIETCATCSSWGNWSAVGCGGRQCGSNTCNFGENCSQRSCNTVQNCTDWKCDPDPDACPVCGDNPQ